MMQNSLLILTVLLCSFQERNERFYYSRVVIEKDTQGMVMDVDGVIVLTDTDMTLVGLDLGKNVVYDIIGEVSKSKKREVYLATNKVVKDTVAIEYKRDKSIMLVDMSTGGKVYFASLMSMEGIELLEKKNEWYSYEIKEQ